MKKRALSWLLALTMLLTLAPQALPTWASAAGTDESGSKTETKLSANTYSALGLSRDVDTTGLDDGKQPYGKAEPGNTVATNVINELYVNFNGSIHYGWSILDNIPMEFKDGQNITWTSPDNFHGAMGYWRPGQQGVHYKNGASSRGALFGENGETVAVHNEKIGDITSKSISSANKHLTYQYSKSEAFSPNTGKDNYVAEMTIDSASKVYLYIYQVEGGNKRYVRSKFVCYASESGGNASDKTNIIYNWEYDAMYDIAAGDMDGDGYDEIAVYASNKVYVYSFVNGVLSSPIEKATAAPSGVNENNGKYKKLKTAVVTLAFGDLNADDKDELVIAENMTYGSSNPVEDNKVGIYALEGSTLKPKNNITLHIPSTGTPFTSGVRIRYANVATGDIDGDYQDELIIAGYISANGNGQCSKENVAYMVVKGDSKNNFENSGWKKANHTIDLLDRVVDNKDQLIPPVALTCAATQGVGHAEQLFLGGWLYSVNLGTSKNLSDVTLTDLTRISTNREYKKDNGNKANKEEIFVVNVVAGNFNGNRNGQEQIVYAFGMKHDDSDRYWYDIGYINKKEPGDTNANSSSGYWYGQEQVMNYESSYNRDQNKSRASLYLSLAAVDCDKDSTLMRYKGQTVTWTKPEVLTVLQSAPYFQDLEDTRGYLDQGQTGLGKSKAAGDKVTAGGSLSLGTYVSFEQDFSVFGVKVASIEAEAQSKNSFTYAYEETKKKETEINYSGSAGADDAVGYAVPYMEYQYETWVPEYTLPASKNEEYYKYIDNYLSGKLKNWSTIKSDPSKLSAERTKAEKELGIRPNMTVEGSWQPSSVMVPMEPAKVLITVDDYDEIAEQTEGLEPIRGNILNSTPGDPATYDAVGARSNDFHAIGNQQKVTTGEGGNITVTETSTTEKSHDFEYSYEFEAKVGAGAGGLTVGVLAGFGANAGGGISTSSSKSYSATVDNLPKDASNYGFSWQFGYRKAKLNNNDVLVLEYQIKDVAQLPSPPKNLRVESVTSDSVTLSWDPVTGAGAYKIYQLDSTGKTYRMKTLAGTATSWTNTGLSSNTSYTYVAKTITQDGQESLTSASVHAGTLEKDKENFKILTQPTDQTSEATAGSQLQFTVTAEYRNDDGRQNELNYQWETYNTTTRKWETVNGAESQTLTVTVTDQNDGKRYRCQVYSSAILYLYSKEVTLKVGRSTTETSLTATPTGVIKSAYMEEQEEYVTENGQQVYEQKAKTEGEYTLYSYSYQDTDDQTQKVTVYAKKTGTATDYYASKTDTQPLSKATKKILTYGDSSQDITTIGAGESVTDKAYTVTQEEGGGSEAAVTYTATTKYKLDTDGKKILYYCPANTTDKTEAFWFVEVTDKGTDGQNTTTTYYAEVEDVVKLQVTDTLLIDEDQLQLETVDDTTKPVKRTVQVNQDGDTVTLTANVGKKNTGDQTIDGSVTFKIVNTTGDGGVTETVQVGTHGKATMNWKPTTAGVYVVTAIYSGSEMFKESQSQSYTINVVTPGEQKLVLSGENMTYGDTQELKATLFEGGSASGTTNVSTTDVSNNVTYTVMRDGTDVTNQNELSSSGTFTPKQAGTYTITASYKPEGTTTAITSTKIITVNRKTVTISPEVDENTKEIKYDLTDAVNDAERELIRRKIVTNCDGTKTGAAAGVYPITVTYDSDDTINSKYLIVCDNSKTYKIDDSVVEVTNNTDNSNGRVTLSYNYKDYTYEAGGSNHGDIVKVPKGAKLIATAMPNVGYKVEKWLVDGDLATSGVTVVTDPTLQVAIPEDTTKDTWRVEAVFTQIFYKLNYTIDDGTITAKYLNDNGGTGSQFNSGDDFSPLQKVQLTAAPGSGKVISAWEVNGEAVLNKDGTKYTGDTYELSSISGATTISVITEEASSCPVSVTLLDKDGKKLGNGTVLFNPTKEGTEEAAGKYPGQKNQSLTITLNIPDSLIVESWTPAGGQAMQGTLSSDKKKLTISNLQGPLDLTVKCVTPNMYMVTQEVNDGGSIEVYKNLEKSQLHFDSDHKAVVRQASLLRVLAKPTTGYQVKSVEVNGEEPTNLKDVVGKDDKSFVINSVDGPTTINVQFVKKPVISFSPTTTTADAYGSVTANNIPISGGTVPYGSKDNIVFTATPVVGYEVDTWKVKVGDADPTTLTSDQITKVANSDNQTYTYTPDATTGITSDVTVEVSFKELPNAKVNFSVVDKNDADSGGLDGTLKAVVTRYGTATTYDSGTIADVYRDSVVTFVATPNPGYAVTKWIVNGEEQTAQPTLNIGTDDNGTTKTVQVQFEEISKTIKYDITADSDANHGGTLKVTFLAKAGSEQAEDIKSGTSVKTAGTLTAEVTGLNDDYEIESWTLNGAPYTPEDGNNSKLTCDVSETQGADIRVKIVRKSYQINFSATAGGTITATANENPLQNPATVKGDTSIVFTASNPATGYEFTGWKVGDTMIQGTEQSYTLTVKKDTTVQACYAMTQTQYAVTYGVIKTDEQDNGTLSVSGLNSQGKANAGSTVTFTAAPAAGYQVKQWYNAATDGTEIGTAESKEYQITNLTENTGVYVQFEPIPSYEITVNVTGQGSVTATVNDEAATISENKLTVKRHDNVVLTASPATSQYLTNWTLDNEPKGNDSLTLTLSDVKENHTVAANFDASQGVPFKTICGTDGTLEAKAGYGDKLTPINAASGISVDKGKKIVLTATPKSGKAVVWTVNGKTTDELSNTYTIDAISANTEVQASFEDLNLFTLTAPGSNYAVSVLEKYPSDYGGTNEVRQGGNISFKITPNAGQLLGVKSVSPDGTVVANADGSYTVTIENVTSNITFQMEEYKAEPGNLIIPNGYTEASLKSALRTQISPSVSGSNIKYLDIKLQIKDANGEWQDVTADNFPKGGINITILYTNLGNGLDNSYNYSVAHMRADGIIENLSATNGEDGITFHVNSLSPFAIGWYKNTPTPGGGGGGGGAVSTYTLTFDTNGGSAIDKITKDSGATIDLAAYKPTRAGYTFAGWFSDKALTKAVTSVKLTANTTVYAKWTQNGGTAQNPFVDVKEGAYYYDAVLWAVEQKITSGTSATTFSPDASCTRAQMVTFLWRAAGSPKVENGKNPFTDVQADAYYYDAVLWAVEKGVTSGTSATTFSPDATVTRGQTVTFLYRNAGSPEVSGTMPFADVEADAYYAKAVQWAVQQKITTGTSETTFSPMSDCTRGQIVTFLYRAK